MKRRKQQGRSISIEQLESRVVFAASPMNPLLDPIYSRYSIDGTGNNLANPLWGSAGVDFLRTVAAQYADGKSTPSGDTRPSARAISNALADQGDEDNISDRFLSAMIYAWGQFMDHDLDLTDSAAPAEPFNIDVPDGDAYFNPSGVIPLNRSACDPATGTTNARQQVNSITAWIDGSMIYGSDATTAASLRTFSRGLMKTSGDGLLPLADPSKPADGQMFVAGDIRVNENVELTALQTLFVREHNHWAGKIAAADPKLNDEQIYQRARAIVIGELQSITFNQWLPAVLGKGAIDPYRGYNPRVNPGIANEFSTAAFRFGHSLLGDDVEFLDNNGRPIADEVPLSGAFFNPDLVREFGIDSVLKYLASDPSSELDTKVVGSVRNFLFGPPGSGGLDLASLNIQRGRDHGLADYNSVRAAYGLPKVTSFAQITSDTEVQAKLQQLYGTVDNTDLWVGGLAEDHVPGGSVGPTLRAIISDQFERLRDGDRFWYQNVFSPAMKKQIDGTTLADVLKRNTALTNLQGNVFFFHAVIAGRVIVEPNASVRPGNKPPPQGGRPTLELIDTERGEVIATTKVDSQGHYRFDVADGVRTGRYQVRLVSPKGSNAPAITSKSIAITKGDEIVRGVDFVIPATPVTPPPRLQGNPVQPPRAPNSGGGPQSNPQGMPLKSPEPRTETTAQRPSREEVDRVMAAMAGEQEERSNPARQAQHVESNDRTRSLAARPNRNAQVDGGAANIGKLR